MRYLETLRAENGHIKYLNYHQDRMYRTCGKKLILNLQPPTKGVWRVRIIYTQTIESIEYLPYKQTDIHKLQMIEADNIEYSYKFENREQLQNLFTKRADADDVLIIKNSLVTDTTIANIAFFNGKQWITPKSPLLNGTTRRRLIDEKFLYEADIKATEVKNFKKFALMNTLIGFLEIQDGIIHPC